MLGAAHGAGAGDSFDNSWVAMPARGLVLTPYACQGFSADPICITYVLKTSGVVVFSTTTRLDLERAACNEGLPTDLESPFTPIISPLLKARG